MILIIGIACLFRFKKKQLLFVWEKRAIERHTEKDSLIVVLEKIIFESRPAWKHAMILLADL